MYLTMCLYNIISNTNETGNIIVIALMMLSLLSLLGTMSLQTANTNLQIARNERIHVQNFNFAEGAAMQAAQRAVDEDVNISTNWILPCYKMGNESCWTPFKNPDWWFDIWFLKHRFVQQSSINKDAYYAIQYIGKNWYNTYDPSSLEDSHAKLICYGLYKNEQRGEVLIEVRMVRKCKNNHEHDCKWKMTSWRQL